MASELLGTSPLSQHAGIIVLLIDWGEAWG